MNSIVHFLEFVIGAVVTLLLVAIILLVIISRLPAGNPLRELLNLLVTRIGATAAAGMLVVPIEPIPVLDALYDIGAPVFLIYYWYTFFKKIRPISSKRSTRSIEPR